MVMQSFFRYFSKLPSWKGKPPKVYSVPYSLDRLAPGVDGIRVDVYLSPYFCKAVGSIILQFIVKHAGATELLAEDGWEHWTNSRDEFKHHCRELLAGAIEKARAGDDGAQIEYLAQTAIVKFLLLEIRSRFETLVTSLNNAIWEKETSSHLDMEDISLLKEKTATIRQKRKRIVYSTAKELFQYLQEVQDRELGATRNGYLRHGDSLPVGFFANPILYKGSRLEDSSDDLIMVEEYVLLGRRTEEPYTYQVILTLLIHLLNKIEVESLQDSRLEGLKRKDIDEQEDEDSPRMVQEARDRERDGWLKHVETVDILFNYLETENRYNAMKSDRGDKGTLRELKKRGQEQRKFLDFVYKKFEEKGLITFIGASFKARTLYQQFCPPLVPQQVLQFLVLPKVRQDIETHLKGIKNIDGKSLSLGILKKAAEELEGLKSTQKKQYLLEFLKGFAKYHRDLGNFGLLREAMDHVNLVADEKTLNLARANNTIYEFLLPHEQVLVPTEKEKPAVSHVVVIKAKLRGVVEIIRQFQEKGLKPAASFSLDFFDPISELAVEYGAVKLHSEGDAISLAILSGKEGGSKGYELARACGLAVNMHIVRQRYNAKNKKRGLPRLDMGIGIGFEASAPTYLFDDEKKIMISPALDLATRLSGCNEYIRKLFMNKQGQFNLYVFQSNPDEESDEGLLMQYNMNGIGLSQAGFRKLCEEIDLELFDCEMADFREEGCSLYFGKFPVLRGRQQHLIIREASVLKIDAADFHVTGPVRQKFYEVVTHPKLYGFFKKRHY